jgi:hypothetical protein
MQPLDRIEVRTTRDVLRAHLTLYGGFRIVINERAAITLERGQLDELIALLAAFAGAGAPSHRQPSGRHA